MPGSRPEHKFPFYKTYIGIECRKDILMQNEHINQKTSQKMKTLFQRAKYYCKQNKYRLIYFFAFIAIFKMEPIYEYMFCRNTIMNYISNNYINYFMDWTVTIPKASQEQRRQLERLNSAQESHEIAQLFVRVDQNPTAFTTLSELEVFNPQKPTQNQKYIQEGLDLNGFIEICQLNGLNHSDVESRLKVLHPQCF